jgi:hypothetical protein
MNNEEKTVAKSSFTENCTKQQYESEHAGLIFNVYDSYRGSFMPLKNILFHNLFLNNRRVILFIRRLYFFVKPTRTGNTVHGKGQLFFIYAEGA